MVCRRLITRSPLVYNVLDFLDERLCALQRMSMSVSAASSGNCFHGSREAQQQAVLFECSYVFLAENGPPTGVDDEIVAPCEVLANFRFQIPEILPAMVCNDLRNRTAGAPDNFLIRGDDCATQLGSQSPPDCALSGPSITDQHDVHEKRDSKTSRMTLRGADRPVHRSNWAAA